MLDEIVVNIVNCKTRPLQFANWLPILNFRPIDLMETNENSSVWSHYRLSVTICNSEKGRERINVVDFLACS